MKLRHFVVALGMCLLFSSTASAQFTLVCSEGQTTHTFDVIGSEIVGTATTNGCLQTAQLLGFVDFAAGRWYWYRDYPTSSPCTEGVWYSGSIATLMYTWRNTSGATGVGQCVSAITAPQNRSLGPGLESLP